MKKIKTFKYEVIIQRPYLIGVIYGNPFQTLATDNYQQFLSDIDKADASGRPYHIYIRFDKEEIKS